MGDAATYQITLAGSEQQYPCAADDTLLRAALRAGIGMPYECNVGSCGTCKVELVEGAVDSNWPEAPGLSERDRGRKRVLGCQSRPSADCVIKARTAPQYQSSCRPQRVAASLRLCRDLTHDIREFRFQLAHPVSFLPGQYALLSLPGVPGPRAYSLANIDLGDGDWQFQIKRTPDGAGTKALFDRLDVGATVHIDGPYGLAYLRRDCRRDIVCIAGGSGLAPVLSIARGVAADAAMAAVRVHLFYGGRSARDICGERELQALPGYGERFFYHPIISLPDSQPDSQPNSQPGAAWSCKVGFVHELALEVMGPSLPDHEIYFAGPPAMAQAVQAMLMAANVPGEQVHFDAFY